jgi:hypothetical protein
VVDSRNIALLRGLVEAFNRLHVDFWMAHLGPVVELREWPTAPGAQTYRGLDGVQQALDSWFESWDWMQVGIVDLQEVDDRVLVTLHQRAQGKGSKVVVEIKSFNVYTFRDGKVVRIELFTEREPALEVAGIATPHEEEKR